MPGPTPLPTQLKLLKGVRPARINKSEPKSKIVSAALPMGWHLHMSDIAKRFWKRFAPVLSELKILTETDLPALRMTSELWSKWIRLTNKVNSGKLKPKEELSYLHMLDQIESQMLRYLKQFGMTASSRGSISIAGAGEDKDEEFLD